jgi:hypothetical protein
MPRQSHCKALTDRRFRYANHISEAIPSTAALKRPPRGASPRGGPLLAERRRAGLWRRAIVVAVTPRLTVPPGSEHSGVSCGSDLSRLAHTTVRHPMWRVRL